MNGQVNRAAADNQPDEEHQRHQQRFGASFFQRADVGGQAEGGHRHRQQYGIQRDQHFDNRFRQQVEGVKHRHQNKQDRKPWNGDFTFFPAVGRG